MTNVHVVNVREEHLNRAIAAVKQDDISWGLVCLLGQAISDVIPGEIRVTRSEVLVGDDRTYQLDGLGKQLVRMFDHDRYDAIREQLPAIVTIYNFNEAENNET